MRSVAILLGLAASTAAITCGVAQRFTCSTDEQCVTESVAGRCEPESVCSFPDPDCSSGHRFGELSGELSGECVDAAGTSAASDGASSNGMGETHALDESSASTDPSVTATSTSTSTSTTTHGTTNDPDTGAPSGDPYSPCPGNEPCDDPDAYCIQTGSGDSVCAPPCDEQQCPWSEAFMTPPMCTEVGPGTNGCVLWCSADGFCPRGMVCETGAMMNTGFGYCTWPSRE